jgi:NhaA family Na+:H+ antiporter
MTLTARTHLWKFITDNSLLLVAGTAFALLWANLDHTSYEHFAHVFQFPVNDIGMAFFFALAMKEIVEAMLPGGALASPREAFVPLVAAIGGMAAPAGLYAVQVGFVGRPDLMPGWAIPCATDIAFSYMAARLIFPKAHPAIPFLLLLAIADDALGLILIALFYPTGPLSLVYFASFMIPALGIALLLKYRRTRNFWPYVLLGGGLSWTALFLGGFHPALALVPIVPFMPHEQTDLGLFNLKEQRLTDTMNKFEHWWRIPVQAILLLFGLTNAGVVYSHIGNGTWIVMSSLVLGKPIGILLTTMLAVKFGLRAPGGLSYVHITTLGIAAGIGFTVSLFFATAAFAPGESLDQVKMGALLSFIALPIAVLFGRAMGVHPKQRKRRG